jgi:diguanylate cyclase (GGDEF)-like protein
VSFRARLTVFFALIVVLPMIAIAVLVSEVAGDSATGKADAALNEDLEVATSIYEDLVDQARRTGERIGADPALGAALESGADTALAGRARALFREHDVASLLLVAEGGETIAEFGERPPFADASIDLVPRGQSEPAATLTVAVSSRTGYVQDVAERTGEEAALVAANGSSSGTIEIDAGAVPESGEADDLETRGDQDLRVASADLAGSGGMRVALTAPAESGGFLASRPGLALALLAFIVVALLAAGAITRTLQGQIAAMLAAARRIGGGDFSGEVPVVGHDEMAGLASEFNEMKDRLRGQMDLLRRQQVEIEGSVRRIGEAFASGLDRQALLAILVDTAVGACQADYGIVALSGRVGAEAEAGEPTDAVRDVALSAEHRALGEQGLVTVHEGDHHALASAIGRIGPNQEPVGAMTVARAGRAFTTAESDVFLYLLGQAAASVENVALHELVSEQALTDELTGLSNNRAFRETIDKEAARALRFKHDLSLVILDIDDFKHVNDTYGHLQGDAVLRAIGRILHAESRGIDEPARYGGEEFVVALPETGIEGALEVAERIRARIEAEPVGRVEGDGEIRITASLGAATMPAVGAEVRELIAAADAALYEAKRSGKNRVFAASQNGAPETEQEPTAPAQGRAPTRRK